MSKSLLILLVYLAYSLPTRGQSAPSPGTGIPQKIVSRALGEEREYWVSIPASYDNDEMYRRKRYPVLILLDADAHFSYASSMIQFLSAGQTEQIPEMIVVGVRNTDRTRDMTAGLTSPPGSFLTFLENELLPHIDQQYRTLPYRVLVGHSLAGLFALNCFLEQRAFQAYLLIDPTLTWNSGYIVRKTASLLSGQASFSGRLFLAQANNPFEPGPATGVRGNAFQDVRNSLQNNRSKKLSSKDAYYAQENHYSVPLRSLHEGLLFLFEPYQFPFEAFRTGGSSSVKNHYQQMGKQLGAQLLPPGKVINQVGLYLLHQQQQTDQAIELLTLNEDYYPTSPTSFASLGDAYKAKGDTSRAIDYYRKVLSADPNHEQAQQAIRALTSRKAP